MRTSQTHPLRIAEIDTAPGHGKIGITFAPGKKQLDAMSGSWERDLATDLDAIAKWNAAAVVTLLEDRELVELTITKLDQEVRRRHMEWHHLPIADVSVPSARFEATWPDDSRRIQSLLERGWNVLIHCKGGLGRAGMIAGRLLVQMGTDAGRAIEMVRAARGSGAIETPGQERWIRAGRTSSPAQTSRDLNAKQDRAVGALLGLAVGDAVGTAIEFQPKPNYAVIDDMIGGGPFRLKPGQWTDDTSMALALADSLLAHPEFDPADLIARFVDWYRNAAYSCTGTCFDIGNTVRAALTRFERTKEPFAGSSNPSSAGNGALMRLSPVAIRYWSDQQKMRDTAALQTRTTHGASETIDASVLFAEILRNAISGAPQDEVLHARSGPFTEKIEAIATGNSWRGRHREGIRGSGYVVDCLNSALWAVSRTTNFRSAIPLAANLGEDADTTSAVAGQLAGALYGVFGIPHDWMIKLAWREKIENVARKLFEAGAERPRSYRDLGASQDAPTS
jgi:ADP-ribosyl-[dinitrogen reductase] hydrolase